jgi:hypothetical protein
MREKRPPTTPTIQELSDLLREWRDLGDLPGGGYGGTLRQRTDDALDALKTFRDEIRETVSPHKFGGSNRTAMLWLLMLDSSQDEETGDANEWHYWVGRFGKRLLYIYPSGRCDSVLCSTEEEAKRSFENEAHAYGEVLEDVD